MCVFGQRCEYCRVCFNNVTLLTLFVYKIKKANSLKGLNLVLVYFFKRK